MTFPRSSGLLLHLTSLPSPYGIGDLGPSAYRFADWLAETHQQLWQVLPLGPVGNGASPYASPSTFAGNPLLLSPDRLRDEGLVTDEDLAEAPAFPASHVDFGRVVPFKAGLLDRAFDRFEAHDPAGQADAFEAFCRQEAAWLDDYALFMALKEAHGGGAWTDWPTPLVQRDEETLADARPRHARAIRRQQYGQFLFSVQWRALKAHANGLGLRIFGDLPIYVAHDSADVWARPDLFHLDEHGRATVVAGVPPDYFSETGQRWGNPIYRWDRMQANGFQWWTRRLQRTLSMVDLLRLDHFRAFEAYWEVPASAETAIDGRWVEGPGASFFEAVQAALGPLPLVAEDLGIITPPVRALMQQFDMPGMVVLQFAFGGDPSSSYLPHHHRPGQVAYTGTHDNDTTLGWWRSLEDDAETRAFALRYFGLEDDAHVLESFVRALMGSVAQTAIMPLQDVLGLGSEGRMNTPGLSGGNWAWRFEEAQLTPDVADRLRALTELFDRLPSTDEDAKAS